MEHLVHRFQEARLALETLGAPLAAVNRDIFQMDIQRRPSGETFRLWRGHASNRLEVPSVEREGRQLVLLVQEAMRVFELKVPKRKTSVREAARIARARNGRVLKETAANWILECRTPANLRRYLCGLDERHLFVAQFEPGTTVREAHESLKPQAVVQYENSGLGPAKRQGEWFLLRADAEEIEALRGRPLLRSETIGGRGHAHVADEVVRAGRDRVYARGRVSHPDHQTILLEGWHRVVRNAEILADPASNGLYWID